jgi:hypothetical protein
MTYADATTVNCMSLVLRNLLLFVVSWMHLCQSITYLNTNRQTSKCREVGLQGK